MKTTNWIQQADQALKRASLRARNVAASTNTPLHLMRGRQNRKDHANG